MPVSRREILKFASTAAVAGSTGLALGPVTAAFAQSSAEKKIQRAAAIQFEPKLGDVSANLARADALVRDALSKGARWIVLPEFFPSGTAMHPSMFDSHRPLDSRPAQMLKELAVLGRAYVCGSFMAKSGNDVFNTLVLACPDGAMFTHDKDFPTTVFESTFYAGGEDDVYVDRLAKDGLDTAAGKVLGRDGNSLDGAFVHAGTSIGTALCWEIVRNRTAKRLLGKADILLASSGWWTVDPELMWPGLRSEQARTMRTEHQTLIQAAPQRMAKMLGIPVVHANFTGLNPGYATVAFDRQANSRYLGSSQIVDAQGHTVARLGTEQGVLIADVSVQHHQPSEKISEDFWFPEVSDGMRRRWAVTGAEGRDYYLKETRARLAR